MLIVAFFLVPKHRALRVIFLQQIINNYIKAIINNYRFNVLAGFARYFL